MSLIPPALAWNIQIEVTSRCIRSCSNCTRASGIRNGHTVMTPDQFRTACRNVADFPTDAPPAKYCREPRCIGMIGGEPTIHPQFRELVEIMAEEIPDKFHRGLWCGRSRSFVDQEELHRDFGYLNLNPHDPPSKHQPILVASQELIPDEAERKKWTDECWLNHIWSPMVTVDGVFFCEVAATLDKLFALGTALPDEPGWWRQPIEYFADQIDACCRRCGVAMPLPARFDIEPVDDVSPGNLLDLQVLHGNTCNLRHMALFNPTGYDPMRYFGKWAPNKYMGRK